MTDNGIRGLAGSKDPKIVIIPLTSLEAADLILGSRVAGRYNEGSPGLVYLNVSSPVTEDWKGLILLHEIAHADFHARGAYRKDIELGYWHEEVQTFILEQQLARQLGGEAYGDFIDARLNSFQDSYQDIDGRGGTLPPVGAPQN